MEVQGLSRNRCPTVHLYWVCARTIPEDGPDTMQKHEELEEWKHEEKSSQTTPAVTSLLRVALQIGAYWCPVTWLINRDKVSLTLEHMQSDRIMIRGCAVTSQVSWQPASAPSLKSFGGVDADEISIPPPPLFFFALFAVAGIVLINIYSLLSPFYL